MGEEDRDNPQLVAIFLICLRGVIDTSEYIMFTRADDTICALVLSDAKYKNLSRNGSSSPAGLKDSAQSSSIDLSWRSQSLSIQSGPSRKSSDYLNSCLDIGGLEHGCGWRSPGRVLDS